MERMCENNYLHQLLRPPLLFNPYQLATTREWVGKDTVLNLARPTLTLRHYCYSKKEVRRRAIKVRSILASETEQ